MIRRPATERLWQWAQDINKQLGIIEPSFMPNQIDDIHQRIVAVAAEIQDEYPFYAGELPQIGQNLFYQPQYYSPFMLNRAAFGEMFLILKHACKEPADAAFWRDIHPRIADAVKNLMQDGYFPEAYDKAVKELETYLRDLYKQKFPTNSVPNEIQGVIRDLIDENRGCIQLLDCNDEHTSGYKSGIPQIVRGVFAAYRNPTMHRNHACTRQEAFEQIVLTSQLIRVIERFV